MGPGRVRYSLQHLQDQYEKSPDPSHSMLATLIQAFRGIQALPPKDPKSFFHLAGLHGLPFRGPGTTDPNFWGGYCWHASVLFPTWHRSYMLTFENALRSIDGCQDVTLPFWDETLNLEPPVIPWVLTSPYFPPEGHDPNPLYSYKLAKGLLDDEVENERYRKPAGYQTVRYPLSGLEGTYTAIYATKAHNAKYPDPDENTTILNKNVSEWLLGTVKIPNDSKNTPRPDTYSVYAKFLRCLAAPNYTVFSNTTSQNQWIRESVRDPKTSHHVVALENPHNEIHLAVGGFYQKGLFNADPIPGANGDMGDNETAAFDPIFFFHHCFIDYTFSRWQLLWGRTKRGDLTLIPGYPGTFLGKGDGQPRDFPPGTTLYMTTPLDPFPYNSNDVTDINELGYTYGPGSLDDVFVVVPGRSGKIPFDINHPQVPDPMKLAGSNPDGDNLFPVTKRVHNITRNQYDGSFVVRLCARGHDGEDVEVGRESILSRWNVKRCSNCQSHPNVDVYIPLDAATLEFLEARASPTGQKPEISWVVKIQTHDGVREYPIGPPGEERGSEWPKVDDL